MSWIYVKNKVLDWILVWFIKQFLLWVFFEPLLKNWNNLFLLITLRYSWLQERARGRRHGEPNHEWGICYILCFQIFQIQAALVKKSRELALFKVEGRLWTEPCAPKIGVAVVSPFLGISRHVYVQTGVVVRTENVMWTAVSTADTIFSDHEKPLQQELSS